jgi:hypothetical protein
MQADSRCRGIASTEGAQFGLGKRRAPSTYWRWPQALDPSILTHRRARKEALHLPSLGVGCVESLHKLNPPVHGHRVGVRRCGITPLTPSFLQV